MKSSFNNTTATAAAKNSNNWTWVGDSYTADWCRDKCAEIVANGGNAFYKKRGDKYTVYSFE